MKLEKVVSALKDQQGRMDAGELTAFERVCDSIVELSCALGEVSRDQRELVDHLLRTMDDAADAAYGLARALERRQAPPPGA